jgi:hypothetical protein
MQGSMEAASTTITVTLDNSEYLHALIAGSLRRASARAKGRQNFYGAQSADAEKLDIVGSVGECVVAKYLNKFWAGAGLFRGGDVDDYQVRTTTHDSGHLVLNNNDDDSKKYILVCVNNGVGKIRGWLYAREGKQRKYWRDMSGRGPAYYIPQSDLRPISTLKEADIDSEF